MARRPRLESDEAFRQRLISEGVPHSKIQKAIVSGEGFERRQVKAAPRKATRGPIEISSEAQALRESSQHARRTQASGSAQKAAPVRAAAGAGHPRVNMTRSGGKSRAVSNPSAKAIVRGGGGSFQLRGGSRGAWRRNAKGQFA
jgi:hypothetical protein